MFAKILLTGAIVGVVLLIALKPWARAGQSGRARIRRTGDDLVVCPSCGVYRLPDRPCGCG